MAAMSGARPEMAPASTSLWPARYLVHDWMERSAPSSRARWFIGVAKVESMSRLIPRNRSRTSASARRSATRRYGLVGDSETISRVLPGCTAAASEAVSPGSTSACSTPNRERNARTNWRGGGGEGGGGGGGGAPSWGTQAGGGGPAPPPARKEPG